MVDERKTREIVKYIALKSVNDPTFGRTKLNKVLFYCDFLAYKFLGSSITGDTYHKEQFGPVPNSIRRILDEMKRNGEIVEILNLYGGYEQYKPAALVPPDMSVFGPEEVVWVDNVLDQLRKKNATQVSDLSHRFHGWQLAEMNETIPYESVLFSVQDPTEEEIAYGKSLTEYASECLAGT
ncbi:MAG TPA: Panacea domain-containing protein [bacterium]|nr:Panacea domain-containing protein [bacterium]